MLIKIFALVCGIKLSDVQSLDEIPKSILLPYTLEVQIKILIMKLISTKVSSSSGQVSYIRLPFTSILDNRYLLYSNGYSQ